MPSWPWTLIMQSLKSFTPIPSGVSKAVIDISVCSIVLNHTLHYIITCGIFSELIRFSAFATPSWPARWHNTKHYVDSTHLSSSVTQFSGEQLMLTFSDRWRMPMGKLGVGSVVSQRRKSGWGLTNFSSCFSRSCSHFTNRWQFCNISHWPRAMAVSSNCRATWKYRQGGQLMTHRTSCN